MRVSLLQRPQEEVQVTQVSPHLALTLPPFATPPSTQPSLVQLQPSLPFKERLAMASLRRGPKTPSLWPEPQLKPASHTSEGPSSAQMEIIWLRLHADCTKITLCSSTPIPTSPPPESPSHSLSQCQEVKMEADLKEPGQAIWGHNQSPRLGPQTTLGSQTHPVQPPTQPLHLSCWICNITILSSKHRKGYQRFPWKLAPFGVACFSSLLYLPPLHFRVLWVACPCCHPEPSLHSQPERPL